MPVVAVLLAILVAFAWPAKEATAQTPTPPAPTPPFQVKTIGQSAGGTPLVTSNTPTGLAPATIGAVYNLRTGLVSPTSPIGAGQVIAIVDAYHDPNALSDLNAFNAEYGYPALGTCSARPPFTTTTGACFYQADPEGTTPVDPNGEWTLEESLDIEWAHAEAPGATIVLVEAATSGYDDLMNAVIWANDNGATEVSMSFGGIEFSGETVYDSDFDAKSTSTGAPILYTASAGDGGSEAEYPAASPNVIAVGGTTLNGCSNTSCAHFSSETAWSGSGGGVSAYEKISAYQTGYGGPVYSESSGGISALTGGMRAIPDVSFEANPNTGVSVYDSTTYSDNGQSGWFTIGGTSVGAPNWAGIFAAGASNATALQSAQAIYGGGYASYLKDITGGSNGYSAGTGYDLVTGLGSPVNYPPLPTVTGVSPSSGPLAGGTAVTVTGTGFVPGSTTVDFGTSPATSVSVSSPDQLSATSPVGTSGAVNVTVTTPIGTSATSSSDLFAYVSSPQGNWVGSYGGSGYALAAWNGSSDATYLPGVTLSLVQGNRYQWISSTTDVRALESPDQSTRKATCWYASSQLELQLSFSSAYSGNLELYALDWDSTSRRETMDVNDGSSPQVAALTSSFNAGAWMVFPISVASGGTVTITVQLTGGANAVLSGIFLGGPDDIAASSAPQGNWVGSYGGSGYALAAWNGSSDATYLPGVTLSLVQGNRYQWISSTTDVRALESPDQSTRKATCWYASSQLELQLSFSSAYSGNLELYALDWDSTSRRETMDVNDGSSPQVAALTSSFNAGAWMVFPISVASGGTVTITVQLTGGANAVLSGIFLGGPDDIAASSAPQGNWVGSYGGSGYALAAWNGSSDATYLPGVTLSLVQGNRYQWISSTTDVRALESPDQSTRKATCWYANSQLELQLSFSSAYSGNLELYALDWDSTSRRETMDVNDGSSPQVAALTSSFNAGAWMVFPISVASGGTVTITVQLTGGANAVLSGIFLG